MGKKPQIDLGHICLVCERSLSDISPEFLAVEFTSN